LLNPPPPKKIPGYATGPGVLSSECLATSKYIAFELLHSSYTEQAESALRHYCVTAYRVQSEVTHPALKA